MRVQVPPRAPYKMIAVRSGSFFCQIDSTWQVINGKMNKSQSEEWIDLPAESLTQEMDEFELKQAMIDASKLWLAHDGLWFQAVESKYGIDAAIDADREAWKIFTTIEAKRIMERLGIKGNGTIDDLANALRHRLYANINIMRIQKSNNKLRMTMTDCRVQSARKRKKLDPFPCKAVGIVEYEEFAKCINPKFVTKCVYCPPDDIPDDGYCQWEFELIE
jgi:hypothetical protein